MQFGYSDLPEPVSLTFAILLITITVFSSICSSIIPIIHFGFGRCQGHPTRLIAIICLIDLIVGYNLMLISLNIYNIESGFHIEEIFSLLTFHFNFTPSDVGFCALNLSLFVLLETLSLAFNICLAIDLIITLKQPFLSGKSRELSYYLSSIVGTVVLFLVMASTIKEECIDEREDSQLIISDFLFPTPLMILMIVFEVIAFGTVALALVELYSKKSQTRERRSYIKQHLWILITFMLAFVFPCINNFFDQFEVNKTVREYVRNLSFISLLLAGSFVNIVRLTDKYVRKNCYLVWNRIKHCNFKRPANEVEEESNDAWNVALSDVVVQFQNESIIQNIVFVVQEVSKHHDDSELLGSTVQISKDELELFLIGKDKNKLEDAAKLKKKIETWCVGYMEEDKSNFRDTVLNYNTISKREDLEEEGKTLNIKATALAYYVFQKIRIMDGLNTDELNISLDLIKNYQSIRETKESLGASGSFFFFTFDKRLIIKTISSQESECLLDFLPEYYMHLCENPNSVLAKIYGIYIVEIAGLSKITFLLMENSFYTFDISKIKYQIFDMKGSLVKREVKNPVAAVLKDVNFLKLGQSFIFMRKQQKCEFMQQVSRDIGMLASHNIMDYSLLLGIASADQDYQSLNRSSVNWKWLDSGSFMDQRIFSISIIDYLQKFNCQKYMELKFKTFFSPNNDVSCINTAAYYDRFLKYLDTIIVVIGQ